MSKIKELSKELLQTRSKEALELKESIIVSIIDDIIKKVKYCEKYTDAELLFKQLFMIQDMLAELLFVHHIPMIPSLRKFIRDCERLDDPWLRKHLFQKIQDNTYSLT